ncbi:hypothetical protein [Aeropyrum pernix]|nr:hypothetical protein [Aeropyrum pernix]
MTRPGMLKRAGIVALVDLMDTLKPPGLDVLAIIVGSLASVLVVIQPFTSASYMLSYALDPTLFAATIFLALRGAAGITCMAENGLLQLIASYPIGRLHLAIALYTSRVLVPSLAILGAPTVAVAIVMMPVALGSPLEYLATFTAYTVQAVMYGSFFMLIALASRSPGTSGILSVAFYFAYIVVASTLLYLLGRVTGREILVELATASYLPGVAILHYGGGEIQAWQPLLVPLLALSAAAASILYFTRRLEP